MSKFWTHDIIQKLDLSKPQLLNDSFTPSGLVHMGSPISPTIHDAINQQIIANGGTSTFQFGFDDFDVVDGLSDDLMPTHKQYFGVPLFKVPAPPNSSAKTFADHYIAIYKQLAAMLHITPTYYRTSELYISGTFDPYIKKSLDNAQAIREIYKKVSGSDKGSDWYPFQVICQQCGKLGTTKVIGWDGQQVEYRCEPSMVTWAEGCGHSGKMSPLGGNGKMPWRVEWAAKWAHFGVTLEAAGKDHASKGSSFDVSGVICQQVFKQAGPLKVAHEFILWEGKKMSSSSGVGVSGQDFFGALPATLVRFFYLRTRPNVAIEMRPMTEVVPKLFDEFDRLSLQVNQEDEAKTILWQLSTLRDPKTVVTRTIKFSTIAQWLQMPNVDILAEAQDQLGELTQDEQDVISSKIRWAAYWLEHYAGPEDKFEVQQQLPALHLSQEQRTYLGSLAQKVEEIDQAEDLQQAVYELAKELELPSKDAFSAIYQVFLDRSSGPKAGWLLHSLDKQFVIQRLRQAAA